MAVQRNKVETTTGEVEVVGLGVNPQKVKKTGKMTVADALFAANIDRKTVDKVKMDGKDASLDSEVGAGQRITAVPKTRGG